MGRPRQTAQGGGTFPRCAQSDPPRVPQVPLAIPSPPACWVLTVAPSQTIPGTLTRISPAPSPSCRPLCTPRTSTLTLWQVPWATCPQQGPGEALQLHPSWLRQGRPWVLSAPQAWQQPLAWRCQEPGVRRPHWVGRTTATRSWKSRTSAAAALTARAMRASLCPPRPRQAKGGAAAEPVWGEGFHQGGGWAATHAWPGLPSMSRPRPGTSPRPPPRTGHLAAHLLPSPQAGVSPPLSREGGNMTVMASSLLPRLV